MEKVNFEVDVLQDSSHSQTLAITEKVQLLFYLINKRSRESEVELLKQLSSMRSYSSSKTCLWSKIKTAPSVRSTLERILCVHRT